MRHAADLFIFATGSEAARGVPEIARGAMSAGWNVYTVITPGLATVTDPEAIHGISGVHPIRDYGQEPLDRFPFGVMLVAPCTFNTFNKLAHGLADNLATAMLADAIGAGCPLLIAPAMNRRLWQHPQTHTSAERLTRWGCVVIPPSITEDNVRMASADEILGRLLDHSDEMR
jgi:phosphopantothenoylcysteine synthetase/decarboxylase